MNPSETQVTRRRINKSGWPVWAKTLAVVGGVVVFLLAGTYAVAVWLGNAQTDAEYEQLVKAEQEASDKYESEFSKPRATVAQDLALDKVREQRDSIHVDVETYKSTHFGVWNSLVRGGKIWVGGFGWMSKEQPIAFGILLVGLVGVPVVVWNLIRSRKPQPVVATSVGLTIPTQTPAPAPVPAPAPPREERRSNRRIVRTMTANLVMGGGATRVVSLEGVSQTGCFLETDLFLQLGELVTLWLRNEIAELEVTGQVVWYRTKEEAATTGKPVGAGVKFLGLSKDKKDQLARLLAPKPPPLPKEEESEGAGNGSDRRV